MTLVTIASTLLKPFTAMARRTKYTFDKGPVPYWTDYLNQKD